MWSDIIILRRCRLSSPVNTLYSLFQPLLGLHVSLVVDCCTFDHVLLVYDAFKYQKTGSVHFPAEGRVLDFFLSGRSGVMK